MLWRIPGRGQGSRRLATRNGGSARPSPTRPGRAPGWKLRWRRRAPLHPPAEARSPGSPVRSRCQAERWSLSQVSADRRTHQAAHSSKGPASTSASCNSASTDSCTRSRSVSESVEAAPARCNPAHSGFAEPDALGRLGQRIAGFDSVGAIAMIKRDVAWQGHDRVRTWHTRCGERALWRTQITQGAPPPSACRHRGPGQLARVSTGEGSDAVIRRGVSGTGTSGPK